MKSKVPVAAAVALSALVVVAVEGLWPGSGPERRARAQVQWLSRELDLTAEQAAEIETILLEHAALADADAAREQVAAVLTGEQRERLRRLQAEHRDRPDVGAWPGPSDRG